MPADDHDEIVRLYGPWLGRTPEDAAALLVAYPGTWWVAGGWAIEAFTGVPRPHGDLDLGIPRSDVPLLRHHVHGRLDVWAAHRSLTPLVRDEGAPPSGCGNLWLRHSGADPWEYDVLLMSTTASTWTYKRDPRITRPLPEILWTSRGIDYLRPEVQLLHKAPGLRPKDQQDFDACLPMLDGVARQWLRASLDVAHPGHPWSGAL